jgi:hypothetical protein
MSVPGHTNNPNGRAKGSTNKNRQVLFDKAKELGVDPFEILLLFAKGDYDSLGYDKYQSKAGPNGEVFEVLTISPELRQKSARDACEYLFPKLKSVEFSTDEETKKSLTLAYANPKHS